ncbi:Phospholipase A and acyltransferase 5 [Saguinus oedipus]|uniref:Phospholipase A and acyltransferase 5 n=1 Tax=Saguinus oedipus TaxID=9490 RepID=A0ABQ9UUX1_SAGOE|nr:Phospholipase A and acyltransferase 5 [Saguinus oedipus]
MIVYMITLYPGADTYIEGALYMFVKITELCLGNKTQILGLRQVRSSGNRAMVKYSRLEDVLHGCSWKVNNKLDGTYLPLPVDEIIQRTKKMVNKIVQYSLIEGNCEHFVNGLRYGVPRSQQV